MSARRTIDILLVEDNPGDVRLAEEAFREAGVPTRIQWVTNGVEALNYLRHQGRHAQASRPDLVLLDLKLPKKDGKELLAELRTDAEFKGLPIFVLTSSFAEDDVLRASQLQANAFLTKPLDLDAFVEMARSIDRLWQTIHRASTQSREKENPAGCFARHD